MDKPFELVSDACECPPAVGVVLMQENRPVCFYSGKLSGAELQYSASDIKMQSVIAALQEWLLLRGFRLYDSDGSRTKHLSRQS